ncbi:carboxylesterase family protein [Kutzneria sp. CA-103260]|uniref:carboxylesterase family protein n=1 Tax=Kutzneria sp. CA-103260 TaxID=2802641 RepID=UPI001BA6B05D|nr:carboxylesterase family protein [Kutzneria sp. CA-103260]QUQ64001.1 carboxylesterase [Kutzneria sp. CA-103260]
MTRVRVESGELAGKTRNGVTAFLGIPYAAPVIGAARFRPPAPLPRWTGTRAANEFGPSAPQPGGIRAELVLGPSTPSGPDCLVLNVWTPRLDPSAGLPVLVWQHGGGWINGSGSVPALRGDTLAREAEAVVVTVNYRLGPFGFATHPELTGEHANLGLLDQRAALDWVHRNIEGFGGDPGRLTLGGDSAGAMSAAIQSVLPGTRRPAALALHGGVPSLREPAAVADIVEQLAALIGVPVRGLAELDDEVLIAGAMDLGPLYPFGPVAAGELDGGLPDPAGLPTLLVTTADEGTFYLVDEQSPREFTKVEAERVAAGLLPGDAVRRYGIAAANLLAERACDPRWALAAAVTTALMDEPADAWAAQAGPVWRFRYVRPATLWDGWLGATHTLDVPVLFGNHRRPELARLFANDPGVDEVSARMRREYKDFLHRSALDRPVWTVVEPYVHEI